MTEEEWISCRIPQLMTPLVAKLESTERQRRLCICSAIRALLDIRSEEIGGHIDIAERFADGMITASAIRALNQLARTRMRFRHHELPQVSGRPVPQALLEKTLCYTLLNRATLRSLSHQNFAGAVHLVYRVGHGEQASNVCPLLRDIFGNPFRPVSFSPAWRTTTAVAIAQSMYDSRDFAPMPLLADALQDAGCETPEIIDHCRGAGPHVRGCWVVDGVLGKA